MKIPVDTVGAINDPVLAESLLRDGVSDFVSMARSFIADPDWVEKVRSGHADDIRPCVRCLRCLNPDYTGDSRCTVNPQKTWFHMEHALVRPTVKKKQSRRHRRRACGDAGCNEGRLTVAMMSPSMKKRTRWAAYSPIRIMSRLRKPWPGIKII